MTILKCNEMFQSGDVWEPCQMDAGHWPNLPHGKPVASTGDTPQPQDKPLTEADQKIYDPFADLEYIAKEIPDEDLRAHLEYVTGTLKELLAATGKTPDALPALKLLYEETAEYIRINNLGDVHHNRSMQMARDVLAATLPAREAKKK